MMKQSKLILSFGALFLACTLLLCVLFQSALRTVNNAGTAVAAQVTPTLILDAGHGGEDAGAIGANGVLEKNLNFTVTHALAQLLRMAGYNVVETRTEDRLLCEASTPKGHRKQRDLSNRLRVSEENPDSVFISIHMNTFPLPSCTGTQIWYSPNDPASIEWAKSLQASVKEHLQPDNNRKIKAATSAIYLLRHATNPAILIECGFLSSPSECEQLCDSAYQQALTLTLFAAITAKIQADTCAQG